MNAVVGLASGNIGQTLVMPLLADDRLLKLSQTAIRPFYQARSQRALAHLKASMPSGSYRVHVSEGALFLWIRFPDLPISSAELYQRLKSRGVLVVPGETFFFGTDAPLAHRTQCIRLTFSMSEEVVIAGINVLAEVIAEL